MEQFLRDLWGALPSWARALSNPLVARMLALFRFFFGLLRATRHPWRAIYLAARALRTGVLELGHWTYYALINLRDRTIPAWSRWAYNTARLAAVALVQRAVLSLTIAVTALRAWARLVLAALSLSVAVLRAWARAQLAALALGIARLNRRVFTDWANPQRLAAWLVGAMWTALWRHGYGQLDRIADALWRQRQRLALRTVAEIERIVGRLL